MAINNDSDFKAALNNLSPVQQRRVAARFTENVLALCHDDRVKSVVESAKRGNFTDAELGTAFQFAKAASVDSYTQCGHECDWDKQAGHFVAEAALACVKPADDNNPAWDAAMHARMARTCASIAAGNGTGNEEDAAQYRILRGLFEQPREPT
jgi:3'-phosphoadenosine 5'-phosphosulfate (PAPS) 3'-phosphatase